MRKVGIIGGRVTGTSAFVQLVGTLSPGDEISIFDAAEPVHPPVFSDEASGLLLNTSPDIGSLVSGKPDDFLDYLAEHGITEPIPRSTVGRYARARYEQYARKAARRSIAVSRVTGTVTSVTPAAGGGYELRLTSGATAWVSHVVFAMGRGPAKRVPGMDTLDPYPATALEQSRPGNALVVGMGPSGIDAALTLAAAGHRVDITSRHGLFPAVRTRTPRGAGVDVHHSATEISVRDHMVQPVIGGARTLPPEHLESAPDPLQLLRRDIADSDPSTSPWQDTLADIVTFLGTRNLPVTDAPFFVWRYLTSIMLPVATRLEAALSSGKITVVPLSGAKSGDYDTTVSAIGFHPYPVSIEGATVHLGDKRRAPLSHLSHDLRVRVPENDHPERIWAIGPAAQFAFPFAAAIIVTVLHSAHVAEQIANS